MNIREARAAALHHMAHHSDGYDGYTAEDAAETTTSIMVSYFTGALTVQTDIRPYCDQFCR